MADLTITAANVSPVKIIEQHTVPANEAIDAGEAIYLVAASGKAALADEDAAAPANEPEGISITSANAAGITLTFVKQGWLDLGNALDGLNYGDPVYLSATAGKLADADPGNGIRVGEVWPSFGATTADKILRIDFSSDPGTVDTAQIAADAITGAKIADDSIDSEHYVDGSIDTAHIAADAIDGTLIADNAVNSEHITAGAVDKTHLSGGFLHTTLVNGAAAGDHTVTGIATTDEIVFIGHFSTAAAIATLADLTSEFTITGANTINNAAGTDTTNDQLMVMWLDLTA